MKKVKVVDWFENVAGGTARELSDSHTLARNYKRRNVPLRVDMNPDDVVVVQQGDGEFALVHDSEIE